MWIGNPKPIHTFTYTPGAGRTVALLGNRASAYGQVWHALTSKEPMTGEEYVRIACELSGRPYALQVAPRWGSASHLRSGRFAAGTGKSK